MIAIALAAEPLLLIADEPTTALDVTVQAQVLDLLADIQRELGMAVLLITHDLAVVKNVAHHVALMRGGEIVESASAEEFFRAPRHPYARQLFDAIPTFDKRGAPLTEQGRQARQGSRRGERGAGAVVLDVQDLQVHYPVRRGRCAASCPGSRRPTACPSRCAPARRWPCWASPAAARPPPARRCCA